MKRVILLFVLSFVTMLSHSQENFHLGIVKGDDVVYQVR